MTCEPPKVCESGWYNQKQCAAALGIHPQTVAKYAAEGKLPFRVRKADNKKVVSGAAIMKFWNKMYL